MPKHTQYFLLHPTATGWQGKKLNWRPGSYAKVSPYELVHNIAYDGALTYGHRLITKAAFRRGPVVTDKLWPKGPTQGQIETALAAVKRKRGETWVNHCIRRKAALYSLLNWTGV